MVKRVRVLSLIVVMLLILPVFANGNVKDDANLFTDPKGLETKISELESTIGYPVYIITTDRPYRADLTAQQASDLMLMERVGKNNNGFLLAINMYSRDVTVTSSGPDQLTVSQADDVFEAVQSELRSGNYDAAANVFHDKIRRIKGGNFLSFTDAVGALIASVLGVGGYGASQFSRYHMKKKHKPFPLLENSLVNIAAGQDMLIDTRRIVTAIPKSNKNSGGATSHTTGGGSFTGRSGKF